MNLQNLHEGQVLKNYKELCKLLEIDEKHGNSKDAQMLDLERYFRFTKNKHEIKIEQIYPIPMVKSEERKIGYNSKYVSDLSIQILNILAKRTTDKEYNQSFFTANRLFELTGMCNSNFSLTKKAISDYFKDYPQRMTDFDIEDFKTRTGDKLRKILNTTLFNLKKRQLILYSYKHMILIDDEWEVADKETEVYIMNTKKDVIYNILSKYDDIERGIIIPKEERMIFLKGLKNDYYREVNGILFYDHPSWERICKGFLIEFHGSIDESTKKYKKEIKEISEAKLKLNKKIGDFINKDAERRTKNNKRDYEEYVDKAWKSLGEEQLLLTEEKNQEGETFFKYHDNYLSNQETLTDYMIVIKKK